MARFGSRREAGTQVLDDAPAVEFTEPTTEPVEAESTDTVQEATPEVQAEATPAKAKRAHVEVGAIIVRKSTRTDFSTRASTTDTNPVYLAAKGAEVDGEPVDILVDPDKIEAAKTILRRAASPKKLNVGMHIAPAPYPIEDTDEGPKAVVTFKVTSEKRKTPVTDAVASE